MRGWLLSLLVLTPAVFAGCLGSDDSAPLDQGTAVTDDRNTAAPTGRGRIVAFEETNATEEGAGGLDHHHDDWGGALRVLLMERSDAVPFYIGPPGTITRVYQPDLGARVYEGTDTVEFTISNPTRNTVTDPTGGGAWTLSYQHAATTEWIDVGPAAWGTATSIRITNPAHTDMPHGAYSLWRFRLASDDPAVQGVRFDIKVDIVRGEGEIPLWPGHPAFYLDGKARKVLETTVEGGEQGIAADIAPSRTGDTTAARPTQVISYGTRTVYVYLNITSLEVTNPVDQPTNFFLVHTNASGRTNYTHIFDFDGEHPVDETSHMWILPVDDGGMDSPYADGSRWQFELGAAFVRTAPNGSSVTCYRNCATWTATYDLTVFATADVLAKEAYDWPYGYEL